jgi:hypothetical protein
MYEFHIHHCKRREYLANAIINSQVHFDGISGTSVINSESMATYPSGRLLCDNCFVWNDINKHKKAWVVINSRNERLINGLICNKCSASDDVVYLHDARTECIAIIECFDDIRQMIMKAKIRYVINRWKRYVIHRKKKRQFVRNIILVLKNKIEIQGVGYNDILTTVIKYY